MVLALFGRVDDGSSSSGISSTSPAGAIVRRERELELAVPVSLFRLVLRATAIESSSESSITIGADTPDVTREGPVMDDDPARGGGGGGALRERLPLAGEAEMGWGAGTTSGAGFGLAYISVHWRALASCCLRFRTYSVAIEGTGGEVRCEGSVRWNELTKWVLRVGVSQERG